MRLAAAGVFVLALLLTISTFDPRDSPRDYGDTAAIIILVSLGLVIFSVTSIIAGGLTKWRARMFVTATSFFLGSMLGGFCGDAWTTWRFERRFARARALAETVAARVKDAAPGTRAAPTAEDLRDADIAPFEIAVDVEPHETRAIVHFPDFEEHCFSAFATWHSTTRAWTEAWEWRYR